MKNTGIILLIAVLLVACSQNRKLRSPGQKMELSYQSDTAGLNLLVRHGGVEAGRINVGLKSDRFAEKFAGGYECQHTGTVQDYNEYVFVSQSSPLQLQVRLFDDAVAFRYLAPGVNDLKVEREYSAWQLPDQTKVWYFERKNDWKLKSYAGTWENCDISALDTVSGKSAIQGTPLILEYAGGKKGFVSEAGLLNYSGMRLNAVGENEVMADFTEGNKGFTVNGEYSSPWRVLFVCDDLNALVNQQVIASLSPRPDSTLFADCEYITQGKAVWRWFPKGTGTYEEEREMVTAASRLNFAFTVVDEGWADWTDCWERVRDLADYGREEGVKVFLWKHSHELMNPDDEYRQMRNFLDSVAASGAAGVKVDFMDSEQYSTVAFDIRLLRECAERKLMVNFHGCQSPAGESVTYPNEVTREGIRGVELNKMREGYIPAGHNAALPFTRFVVGHGDYTPVSFTVPGETTFAHQLATLVCFTSPMQMVAEDPDLLLTHPLLTPALDYLKAVPTVWDETRVLPPSEIGKVAVLARRSGNQWFVGILNGENRQKEIEIDLSVLGRVATVQSYTDDMNADKVLIDMAGHRPAMLDRAPVVPFKVTDERLDAPLKITLAPNGGAVVWGQSL